MTFMRIAHTESSCGWGGQEIRILTETEGMMRRGHAVTLICPTEAPICEAARKRNIPVVNLPIARKSWRGFLALRGWLSRNAKQLDLINTHSSTDAWLVAMAAKYCWQAPPLVRTRHVSSPVAQNAPTHWLYTKAMSHVVVTGEVLREQLHRDNRIPLSHITSIPTGIDLTRFLPGDPGTARAAMLQPDVPTIGIVATLRNWKGHVFLLEAFDKLRARFPKWRLLVVGDGPLRHKLENHVVTAHLASCVHFVGNQDNVPDWLHCMDIFCLPSYGDEGVPQSILQAMACGLPVVSTPVGAITEAVTDGVTGLLVPPRDATALADALGRLMAAHDMRAAFAKAGIARAQRDFGIDIMLDKMECVFRAHARGGH